MTCPDRYAVLGNPVAHSQSPFIHAQFAQQTNQLIDYLRVPSPLDAFAPVVQAFAAGGAAGCNVTMPFKFQVLPLVRHLGPRARRAGAANVIRFDSEGWYADNTDGIGLVGDIESNAKVPLAGQRVLLIGAGGAAAGALGALIEARPAQVQVVNRTLARAQALVQQHAAYAAEHGVALQAAELLAAQEAQDVVINSSASSAYGAAVPVAPHVLRPGTLALDMMYGPAAQPFLHWARQHGAIPRDGLGMLVEQAADAFKIFRGMRPATGTILRELRVRLDAAAQQQPQQ
jgi:shikimate dehydrogenase